MNFRRKGKVKRTSNRWIRLPAILWRSMGQDFVVVWLAGRTGWYPCWGSYRSIYSSNFWAIRYCPDSNRIIALNYMYYNRGCVYVWTLYNILMLKPKIRWPLWSWLYGSWIYNYLCNQCLSPLKLWVRTLFMARCTWYNIMW